MEGRGTQTFWTNTPACVLGGTGFLGRHLVGQLLAAGALVRTLSLPGPKLEYTHPRLESLIGDVTDAENVKQAVAGARVVFLAAGPVGARAGTVRRMSNHTTALDSVLSVLPSSARLVLTSSVVTIGGTLRGEVLDELSVVSVSVGSEYALAKRAAEETALSATRSHDVVVVNPGYLFGPDDPGPSVMGHLCLRFWRGHLLLPPCGGISAADVRDVATGHLLAAEHGVAGRRYILGGDNILFSELFAALASVAGLRRAILPSFRPSAPHWFAWTAAAIATGTSALTGKESDLTFEFVRLGRLKWYVSSARAEAELGYRRRPLSETLNDAYSWHAARTRVAPRGLNRLWLRRAG